MNVDKNIVCLKYGKKYPAYYVNRLYNMIERNITGDFNFYCITEDPLYLNNFIKIIPLPENKKLQGWWFKPFVFSKEFPVKGEILFLDLDIVIIKNIDCYFEFNPSKFCIIRDFTRTVQPDWKKYNSSVFKFTSGTLSYVWESIIENPAIIKKYHGDQDWLYANIKDNVCFWPDEWCQSYKWEIRDQKELVGSGGNKSFSTIINPKIPTETNILVFHGNPKPDQVKDPIIVNNWH